MQQRLRNKNAQKLGSINLEQELLTQSPEPVNKPVGLDCNINEKPKKDLTHIIID